MKDKLTFVEQALAEWQHQHRCRSLQTIQPLDTVHVSRGGRSLLNFSANDYLGLSKHPALIEAAQQFTREYGTGATASRLVTGTYTIHAAVEQKLAAACGREAALLFNSGFQVNATLLTALLDRHSCVLCDRLVHNSLLQGIIASRARCIRYHHNDLHHLQRLLQEVAPSHERIVIVTETVFSMDGDRSDVDTLIQLAEEYNALLYLDDAHGIGVMGINGMGLAAHRAGVDITVGTFGKAFGSFGAFITCSQRLRDYLINCCPGFIYTTALPPAVIGAIDAALELMPTLEGDRQYLHQSATDLRTQLQEIGYDTRSSASQIVPLVVGEEARALALSEWLGDRGILATAIRPPTVAQGTARLRLALSSHHQPEHVHQLLQAIQSWEG